MEYTEREALEALLLPSADNMAWILARWDSGSQAAFVARMNATARRLGMTGTSYTDPSGLDPSTAGTAADQVRLGMAAMRMPVLAAIAAKSAAVVPVASLVRNYNTLLGQDGIAGLRTSSAQAARRMPSHRGLEPGGRAQHPDRGRRFRPARHGPGPSCKKTWGSPGHNLVLALDRALGSGVRSGSRDDSEGPPQGPAERRDRKALPAHG